MLPSDVYFQPDAGDPVLDDRTVLALVRRHVASAQAVTGVDESGGEARTYAIDAGIILKTQRPHRLRARTSLEKEVFFLQQLAASPAIPVPQVLGHGSEGGVEYICMTRMPGVAARHTRLEGEARTRLLFDVGQTLRRIHDIPQGPLQDSPLFPGPRSQADLVRRLRDGAGAAVAAIAADGSLWPLDVRPNRLAERALAALPPSADLVALHSNPGPEHIFVAPDALTLTGVIDFGDAYIGHPAFDWRWPRYDDRLTLLAGYQADAPVADGFVSAWRAVLIVGEMIALTTRPERRAAALETLARLKDEV